MSAEVLLSVAALVKEYGGFVALADVTADFQRGQMTAIIGPNGAGKSTFFSLLSGAIAPSAGRITFEGANITGLQQFRFARLGIARSYQITSLFPGLTAHENVRLACQALSPAARGDLWRHRSWHRELSDTADACLRQVGLLPRRMVEVSRLAHGEQRALEIAVALAGSPKLLLLDEPTAGMSPEETRQMMDLIGELAAERTVLLVEHKMKLVMGLADRILVLHHGRLLASGTPDEIRADQQVRRVYLGEGRSGRG